jgi:hypothetical protein
MVQGTRRNIVANAKSKIGGGAKRRSRAPSTRGVSKEMAAVNNGGSETATEDKNLADLLAKFRDIIEDSSATLDPGSSTRRKLEYAYAAFRVTLEANFSFDRALPGMGAVSATPLTAFPWYPADQSPSGFVGFLPFHIEATQMSVGENKPLESDTRIVMPPQRPRSTLELASDLLATPGLWLRTPNPNLGNRKPIDLIDTEEEHKVYDMLNAFDQGLFS